MLIVLCHSGLMLSCPSGFVKAISGKKIEISEKYGVISKFLLLKTCNFFERGGRVCMFMSVCACLCWFTMRNGSFLGGAALPMNSARLLRQRVPFPKDVVMVSLDCSVRRRNFQTLFC